MLLGWLAEEGLGPSAAAPCPPPRPPRSPTEPVCSPDPPVIAGVRLVRIWKLAPILQPHQRSCLLNRGGGGLAGFKEILDPLRLSGKS